MFFVMKLAPLLFLLSVFGVSSAASPGPPVNRGRLYQTVMKMDTVSDVWRSQHAKASVRIMNEKLVITIWNYWGSEHINPIFRITVDNSPEWNDAEGKWSYEGVVRRSAGGPEKDCIVESCTIMENSKDIEFTIVSADIVGRYQIMRKISQKR